MDHFPSTTLVTLPFLALISIPLAITAAITVCFSVLALFLQAFIVSIELCYALVTNVFTIPHSSSWSLLSFTASAPGTPPRRRSSDYGLKPPVAYHPYDPTTPAFWGASRPDLPPKHVSSNTLEAVDTDSPLISPPVVPRRPSFHRHRQYSSPSIFQSLISGLEDRDFEGLGGWRCPPSSSKSLGHRSGQTSPSSTISVSDERDDRAWTSINSRLELPSQPLIRRNSTEGATGPHLPSGRTNRQSTRTLITSTQQRHHRRSYTTSMLSGLGVRSLGPTTLSSTARPESNYGLQQQQQQQFGSAQPRGGPATGAHVQNSYYLHWDRHQTGACGMLHGLHPHNHHSHLPDGSYFALQTQAGNEGRVPVAPTSTTGNTTPNEERKPIRSQGSWITHSPSSGTRDRRRSMSRSSSRVLIDPSPAEEWEQVA